MPDNNIPAPPPGFVVDDNSPQPPPGFKIDPPMSAGTRARGNVMGAFGNELLASQQGANPTIYNLKGEPNYNRLGDLRDTDGGPMFINPDGDWKFVDATKHVVFVDPKTNAPAVFERNNQMEEGGFTRLGRMLGFGTIMTPLTRLPGGMAATSQAAKRFNQSAAQGVNETLSTATQSPILGKIESGLEATPIVGGIVNKRAQDAEDAIGIAVERVAQGFGGGASREDASNALRAGANQFKLRFDKTAETAFKRVDRYIEPDTPVDMSNTTALIQPLLAAFENAPNIGKSVVPQTFRRYLDDIVSNNGNLSYEQVRQLRTFVGNNAFGKNAPIGNVSEGQWKQLYGALSSDVKRALKAQGPQAIRAYETANRIYERGKTEINDALGFIFKSADGAQGINDQLLSLAKDKGRATNLSTLATIKKRVGPENWNEVASSVVMQLGRNSDGEFSVDKFLTAYKQLNPKARSLIFGHKPNLKQNLDNLANAAGRRKDSRGFVNRSHTGNAVMTGAALVGASIDAGITGLSLGAGWGLGELLTNPKVVGWLVGANAAARTGNQKYITNKVAGLRAMFKPNDPLHDLAMSWADSIEAELNPPDR